MKLYRVKRVTWKRSMCLWWYVPVIWRWLPWTKVPTLYLNKDAPQERAHEYVHALWLWRHGRLVFYTAYLLIPAYRLRAEAAAFAAQIHVMLAGAYTLEYLIDYYAEMLSRFRSYRLPPWYSKEKCARALRAYYEALTEEDA